jgi:prepilin-type N-terminal cleavage/methylation domain-containing protein
MKNQKGFTLIELLIVVAIILIIAAIAIPNLLRARISANEASAVGSMRTIVTGEIQYAAAGWMNGAAPIGFSVNMKVLGGTPPCTPPSATSTCIIDPSLAAADTAGANQPKSGYSFTYTPIKGGGAGAPVNIDFALNGDPAVVGQTGNRHFFADQSGVIRGNPTAKATNTDAPI